jgi:hypothetical protein
LFGETVGLTIQKSRPFTKINIENVHLGVSLRVGLSALHGSLLQSLTQKNKKFNLIKFPPSLKEG